MGANNTNRDNVIAFRQRMIARLGAGMESLWSENAACSGDQDSRFEGVLDPDTAAIVEAEAQIVMSQWMLYRSGVDTDKNPLEPKAQLLNDDAVAKLSRTPIATKEAAAAIARYIEAVLPDDHGGHYKAAMQNLRLYLEDGRRSFNPHCEM